MAYCDNTYDNRYDNLCFRYKSETFAQMLLIKITPRTASIDYEFQTLIHTPGFNPILNQSRLSFQNKIFIPGIKFNRLASKRGRR